MGDTSHLTHRLKHDSYTLSMQICRHADMRRRATGKRTLAEAGDARQQPADALQERQRRRKLCKLHAAGVAEALPGVGLHIPARRTLQRSLTAGNELLAT